MKLHLYFFLAAFFFMAACKKEDPANAGNLAANFWRVNDKRYPADSVTYMEYKNFPDSHNAQIVSAFSSANGQPTIVQLYMNNVSLDQSTSLSLRQLTVAFRVINQATKDSNYFSRSETSALVSVTVDNGNAFIEVPEMWLYKYNRNGNYVTSVDSVRFACIIQVPKNPKVIEPTPSYWKIGDSVFNFAAIQGIGYPYGSNPYSSYLVRSNVGNGKMFVVRFLDTRPANASSSTPIRVGTQFMIQLYSGANNNPMDTSYRSPDTTDVYATLSPRSYTPSFTVPEIWLYKWSRDASGNLVRDSARFSCDIRGN